MGEWGRRDHFTYCNDSCGKGTKVLGQEVIIRSRKGEQSDTCFFHFMASDPIHLVSDLAKDNHCKSKTHFQCLSLVGLLLAFDTLHYIFFFF